MLSSIHFKTEEEFGQNREQTPLSLPLFLSSSLKICAITSHFRPSQLGFHVNCQALSDMQKHNQIKQPSSSSKSKLASSFSLSNVKCANRPGSIPFGVFFKSQSETRVRSTLNILTMNAPSVRYHHYPL